MWLPIDVMIEVVEVDGDLVLVRIATPVGGIELIGHVSLRNRVLFVERAHIQGLSPGALGRIGLNAIARKLMVEADAESLVIEGGTRTTGRAEGRAPRPFRFPRSSAPSEDR